MRWFVSCCLCLLFLVPCYEASPGGYSLRFHGTWSGDVDRVKIPLGNPGRPVNVGGDFTIEFRMRALPEENIGTHGQYGGGDGWITGNIIIDRDVFGQGDNGDFGISLAANGALAFGVDRNGNGTTIYTSGVNLADGQWHHVAATRSFSNGQMRIFVDGIQRASGTGPAGDVSYRIGRATSWPRSDPYLVLGGEKHGYAPEFPSFSGWLDELRVSTSVRYVSAFSPAALPFQPDAQTAALYHFDEGHGLQIHDTSNASGGPSHGQRQPGGNVADSPLWSPLTPFAVAADHDADGLRNWFESAWFGSTTAGLPHADTDGDGADNLREMIAGTSPINPANRLRAVLIARSMGVVQLQIATIPEKTYRPLRSASPDGPWEPAGSAFTATSTSTLLGLDDPGGPTVFWTIGTSL